MALSKEEIATRYGTALVGYAQDMNALDPVFDDLQELKKAVVANPQIIAVLSDPILDSNEKKATLSAIAQGFCSEVKAFLDFLLEYNRFGNLLAIIDEFTYLYDKAKGITSGVAITAVKLDNDQLDKLSKSIAEKYHLNAVLLENQVDPNIIGGVILEIEDRVINGSVKNKLKKIRTQLISKN
ncbi:ATP synthase F1 subunit delta [Lactobacillus sp. ESL0791]|uniref:ATP synthase F1 subunit delta n=1 Tax=Lactobacillus sp. ESL0791 TaxID=2983234 RepID=UPI0023F9E2F4|nr:ATP synthase F1 subunit delta [Lactobacillus sp. ESL0791]MDF7638775.1 ATP synthase F1 subunit delta [Lactobacillus sp. ESL0791]